MPNDPKPETSFEEVLARMRRLTYRGGNAFEDCTAIYEYLCWLEEKNRMPIENDDDEGYLRVALCVNEFCDELSAILHGPKRLRKS